MKTESNKSHFHSPTGDLCHAISNATIRPAKSYCWHHRHIRTGKDLRACLRAGDHAWPGGYAVAYVTSDGALLSPDAIREEMESVVWSLRNQVNDGWRVVGMTTAAETDEEMYCDHTGELIA